jgi:hypothetical protein
MIHSFSETCGSTFPLVFRKANELQSEPRLFLHESLDRLVGGLQLGQVAFLYGSKQCLALSELLCVRSQLDQCHGGLNSNVIFIDGGNTFDPYLLVQYAEENQIDRDMALDLTLISRAFTCYQLTSLMTQTLPRAVHGREIKFVVVSDIDLFKTALNSLVTIARTERAITLTTSLDEVTPAPFLCAIRQRVDVVLRLEEQRDFTKFTLEKHPTRSVGSLIVKHPTPRVIEEFLEASEDG